MKALITAILILAFTPIVFCQADTTRLINEMKEKLNNHSGTVSSILSDTTYDALHPYSTFREIIKAHADANVLTIVSAKEPGKKIEVSVIIKNKNGKPVPNALVYLYQTDMRGWYAADAPHVLVNEGDYHHARLFGYVKTDKEGKFEIYTIKPSGYPKSDIHVQVMADGYNSYQTEFLFQDDERLKGEALNRAIIDGGIIAITEVVKLPFVQKFSYSLTIKGNN
jgi:protocatechuate 3,4-dioxygenase beta subunit